MSTALLQYVRRARVTFMMVIMLSVVLGGVALAAEQEVVTLLRPLQFQDGAVSGALNKKEARALMTRVVSLGANDGLHNLELISSDLEQQREVHTCGEYLSLIAEGWQAASTFSRAMESFFILNCRTLQKVAMACAAQRGFIKEPVLVATDVARLPPTILPALFARQQTELAKLRDAGRVLSDVIGVQKITSDDGDIALEYEGIKRTLSVTARGDFNCDGAEDLLVRTADSSTDGTYRTYGHVVLTRCTEHAPFIFAEDGC